MQVVKGSVIINKKPSLLKTINRYKYIYLLLWVPYIYYLIYKYIPMFGIIIAFKDYYPAQGFVDSSWVGMNHFQRLFTSYYFPNIFKNTIIISMYHIIFGFPAPIILALLLNEVKSSIFKRVVQTITYLPHFVSWVVVGGIVMQLLSPTTGIVNGVLQNIGKEPIFFITDVRFFRSILVGSGIWKEVGWGAIIYLAALTGVDVEQYEASTIDGATKWQQTIFITIPSIMPVIIIMFILRIGNIMDAGFEEIFVLYSPPVYKVADIFDTYVYREGMINNNYSFATAVGLFKGVVSCLLVILTNSLAKKFGHEGIW